VLVESPAGVLLLVVMMTTAGPSVARAGQRAVLPGNGVLEVAAGRDAAAGRIVAFPVTYFHQVAQPGARVVAGAAVAVVAAGDREGFQVHGQIRRAVRAVRAVRAGRAGPGKGGQL